MMQRKHIFSVLALGIITSIIIPAHALFAMQDFSYIPANRSNQQIRIAHSLDQLLLWEHRQEAIIVKYRGEERPRRINLPLHMNVRMGIENYLLRDDVIFAEPDYTARMFSVPDDPYYRYQWNFNNPVSGGINSEEAWDKANGTGTIVAVVDTGIAYEDNGYWYKKAPDFAGTAFAAGYDFVNNDSHPNDDEGHGTHVAGTIAQTTNNGLGVAGIAYGTSLMPVKVLDSRGYGYYSDIADGIRFAADNGADIINLSLGGDAPSQALEDALRYAYEKGVTIVAAAGNNGKNGISYPAAYNNYVIAAGATRYDETRAPYSNYGADLDLAAPGGDITVDQNSDGYGDGILQQTFARDTRSFGYYFYQGTSMAAPHVSAVAALVISAGGAHTPDTLRQALTETAKDLGTPGWDSQFGWGLIDAAAAVRYSQESIDYPPSVVLTSPAENSAVSGTILLSAEAGDDDKINRVEFFIDDTFIGNDAIMPYEIQWDSASVADGTHHIRATAYDSISQSTSDSAIIAVDNINDPPIANAGSDTSGFTGAMISFNASGSHDPDGTIALYTWDFGDGKMGSGVTLSHTYELAGNYFVTLEVTDNGGLTATDTLYAIISEKSAVDLTVESLNAKDIRAGRRYQIDARVMNRGAAHVTATGHVEVTDPKGNLVKWSGMSDISYAISSGSSKNYEWSGSTPRNAVRGTYQVKVTLFVEGIGAVSGTTFFKMQ